MLLAGGVNFNVMSTIEKTRAMLHEPQLLQSLASGAAYVQSLTSLARLEIDLTRKQAGLEPEQVRTHGSMS